MAFTTGLVDLKKAKEFRAAGRSVTDPVTKGRFEAAAVRLERRAGRKASKIGRPSTRRGR